MRYRLSSQARVTGLPAETLAGRAKRMRDDVPRVECVDFTRRSRPLRSQCLRMCNGFGSLRRDVMRPVVSAARW
jgi:hypothetical protein